MALIDENYLRTTFKIHKDVGSGRITPYIVIASRKLKNWIGTANYATNDADLILILKLAEGSLAMSFLTLNLNTNVRPQGLVKVEKVEGDVTLQYLSPNETMQTSQQFFEQAESLVRDLFQLSDLPSAPEIVAEEEITDLEILDEWLT
jgi:hypothetical protein